MVKGTHHTQKARELIRDKKKGVPNPGQSLRLKGRITPEETKRKMSIAHRGLKHKPMTEQGRLNISLSQMGRVPWNKGTAKIYPHRCKHCEKDFATRKKVQIFCGLSCSGLYNFAHGKIPPIGVCKGRKLSEAHKEKISKAHMGMNNSPWRGGRRNEECRAHLEKCRQIAHSKPMSLETRIKKSLCMMGKNVTNGNSKIFAAIRASLNSKLWREAVFARDDYICQQCGERGGRLHPHHIKPFAVFPDLRFAIDNGKTLCIPCHAKEHRDIGFFKSFLTGTDDGRLERPEEIAELLRKG